MKPGQFILDTKFANKVGRIIRATPTHIMVQFEPTVIWSYNRSEQTFLRPLIREIRAGKL